ncbi:hypothetical protein [Steroidobacter sp.]|uniref:hypothetical protein n=1 Tax=Steroidobacter sp. TaxID=1978227 RepID=UPI001A4261B2|nr:hypothetical protein [Steroidobacter sp.]MBL8270696.1 hypothetical protein [Steroidobacter sp.]
MAAEIDARPPDKLTLSGNGSRLTDVGVDEDGYGGSLNYLHYFTPDVIVGVGGEHQAIADSSWSFGSIRAAVGHGDSASRLTVFGEFHYGDGDENDRKFDYQIGVLGLSKSFTSKFSVQLEGRQIDIDTSHGNLPKLGLTYFWSPRLSTSVSYADSVGGNLGTEIATVRLDHYGQHVNFLIGAAAGRADPSVLNLQPGVTLPVQDLKQGFIGIGKVFAKGEVQLLGDYLELESSEKVTVTLSFTAYLGSRGRAP